MNTTTETLTVDGVVLNTLAKNIESLTGRLRAPALRTSNVIVPGRHGALYTPNKKFDQALITLPMWVVGSDDDGAIPGGSNARREFFKRVDELAELFKRPGLRDVRWTKADGSVRQCFAEALDVMDFTTDAGPRGLFSVNLTVPAAFWQDVSTLTQTFASATGASVVATSFAAATAPMEDLLWQLTGPWTSPRLTFADGSYVAYAAAIPAGQSLTIDSGNWELTGGGGLTPDYTKLTHDGVDAYWAALPSDNQTVTLSGTARTSATSLAATGRRKYVIG